MKDLAFVWLTPKVFAICLALSASITTLWYQVTETVGLVDQILGWGLTGFSVFLNLITGIVIWKLAMHVKRLNEERIRDLRDER